jgi:hypothetical protein
MAAAEQTHAHAQTRQWCDTHRRDTHGRASTHTRTRALPGHLHGIETYPWHDYF